MIYSQCVTNLTTDYYTSNDRFGINRLDKNEGHAEWRRVPRFGIQTPLQNRIIFTRRPSR